MTVYDLTPLTRHADSERRLVIKGRDYNKRKLIIGAASMIPGFVLLGLFFPLLGLYSLALPALCVAAGFWLFEARSRKGLRVANWRRLTDKRSARKMSFRYAGHDVEPLANVFKDYVWCHQQLSRKRDTSHAMRDITGEDTRVGTKKGKVDWSVDLPDDTRSSDRHARVNPELDENW